jgi:hypothetical protein
MDLPIPHGTCLALVLGLATAASANQTVEPKEHCAAWANLTSAGGLPSARSAGGHHAMPDIEAYLRLHRDAVRYGADETMQPGFSRRPESE